MPVVFRPSRLIAKEIWPSLGEALFRFQTPKNLDYWAADLFGGGQKKISEENESKMKAMKVKDLSYTYLSTDDGEKVLVIRDSKSKHALTFSNARRQIPPNEEMRGGRLESTLKAADSEKSIYEVLSDALRKKSDKEMFETSLGGQWLLYLFGNPSPEFESTPERLSKVHPCFKPMFLQAINMVLKAYPWVETDENLEALYEARGRALANAFNKVFRDSRFSLPIEIRDLIDAEDSALKNVQSAKEALSDFDNTHTESDTWYVRRKSNLIGASGALGVIALVVAITVVFSIPIAGPIIVGAIALLVGIGAVLDFRQKEKDYGQACDLRSGMQSTLQRNQRILKEKQSTLDKAMIVEPVTVDVEDHASSTPKQDKDLSVQHASSAEDDEPREVLGL